MGQGKVISRRDAGTAEKTMNSGNPIQIQEFLRDLRCRSMNYGITDIFGDWGQGMKFGVPDKQVGNTTIHPLTPINSGSS